MSSSIFATAAGRGGEALTSPHDRRERVSSGVMVTVSGSRSGSVALARAHTCIVSTIHTSYVMAMYCVSCIV